MLCGAIVLIPPQSNEKRELFLRSDGPCGEVKRTLFTPLTHDAHGTQQQHRTAHDISAPPASAHGFTRTLSTVRLSHQERRLFALNLVLTLVTACISLTFFHPDEHFQILEFLNYKWGLTQLEELPWEFAPQIRPFMQPALFYLLCAPLRASGVTDPFTLALLLRVTSGLVSAAALFSFARMASRWLKDSRESERVIRYLTLTGLLPYLAVRTSSETWSTAFFLFGLVRAMQFLAPEAARDKSVLTLPDAVIAGVCFGMSFECRFQCAFLVVGLVAWLALIARVSLGRVLVLVSACLMPVLVALFVDHWGYGQWTFPPWNYVRVNLIDGVAANQFGTKWFGAYFHITLANIFAPVVLLLTVGLVLSWLRRPRHVITWVTLPFFAVHSAIAHKEERFLFPLLPLALVAAVLATEPNVPAGKLVERAVRAARRLLSTRLYRVVVALNFVALFLLTVYPLGWRPHEPFYRWVYETQLEQVRIATTHAPSVPSYPFFRRQRWALREVSEAEWAGGLASDTLWVRNAPFEFEESQEATERVLLYSELPGYSSAWVRSVVWPIVGQLRDRALALGFRPDRFIWLTVYGPALAQREPLSTRERAPREPFDATQ